MTMQLMAAIHNRDGEALARMSAGHDPKNVINIEAETLVDSLFRQLKQIFPAASQTNLKTDADEKTAKRQWIAAFAEGMYFSFEDIMTQPAKLVIIADHVAEVTLKEGKYHQIKRMFGRFRNPVVGLHRLSIGDIVLDEALASGESRVLTAAEVACIRCKPVA